MRLSVYTHKTAVSATSPAAGADGKAKESLVCHLDDDAKMLGFYPLQDFMTLQVVDTNPSRVRGAFTDTSLVEKYEMPDEEYAKRQDSVLAFKMRNKLGRFSDAASASVSTKSDDASTNPVPTSIQVGARCQVLPDPSAPADGAFAKRGTVRFVGATEFKPGVWVGVEYDEPVGKHDGSVAGVRYFECGSRRGVMVRPARVEVGDFPEEDPFADEEMEM
ncbi:hypothetical protein HDU96_004148 [Phlyctochytrium bullatum]|nr:hypothetical protein HDU96_004148 [Phlyctochytrium bullatum]